MSVGTHFCTTVGTIFIGQVKARTVFTVHKELVMLAFWTVIVRFKGVNLGNTRTRGNERRANRTTRANKITIVLTVFYKLLRDNIKHRKAVFNN